MSTTKKSSPTRHRKEKENKEKREKPQRGNERLKVVVRRLPPNLPEDIFWQSVQNWVNEETISWKIFYPGKFKTRLNKENIPSRAYIAFKHIEQLAQFSREYDGHLFRDKAGNESFAIVEFAPYQKVPSEKKKQDSRNGTIEKDEDYISFVESLKASANAEPVTLEALIAATKPASPPKTTPLLEALKAEKTAQKDKETILRSHAHYKDVTLLRNKEDPKKKLAAAAATANQKFVAAEAASAMGKRGKKGGPAIAPPAIQNQNQKAVAGAKGGAPPPPQLGAGSSAPPPTTPGKKSRAQRHAQQQAKAQTTSTPSASTPVNVQPPVIIATAPKAPPAAVSSGDAAQSTPPTSGGQRRARPVIGLASRQFEAALSGVGVASGERKSRREKEKERQQDKDKEGTSIGGAPNSNDKGKPPPSPKRERGGRRGGAPGGGKPNTNEPQVVKVPSILQRPEGAGPPAILQRDTTVGAGLSTPSGAGSSPAVAQTPVQGGGSGGGGGRGGRRGRGRGRGGPPAGSHRGG